MPLTVPLGSGDIGPMIDASVLAAAFVRVCVCKSECVRWQSTLLVFCLSSTSSLSRCACVQLRARARAALGYILYFWNLQLHPAGGVPGTCAVAAVLSSNPHRMLPSPVGGAGCCQDGHLGGMVVLVRLTPGWLCGPRCDDHELG